MKKLTKQEFKDRIRKISNDKIDVSEFNFENTQSNGKCRCKVCGYEWETKAYSILQGHGCRKCYDKRNSESKLLSIEEVQNKITESGSNTKIIGEYIDTKHKCKAQCTKCGNIWYPIVSYLINGHGCPICGLKKQGLKRRLSEEEYKERCYEKYGDKYNLTELCFTTTRNSVYPICKIHGKFEINANTFLNGRGCQKCNKDVQKPRMTTEMFIEKANKIHNNKYDYSNVNYVNTNTKVCIICKEHGEFLQSPHSHLIGSGCPKCSIKKSSINRKKTTDEFITEVSNIHGNKYDYSKVKYVNNSTKVCIICPTHGEFWQMPTDHLRYCGCPKCGINKTIESKTSTTEEFIKKSKAVHGDKYDYSNVEYINSRTKVCIICTKHGEFWQTPHEHLDSCGCPKCANHLTKAETEIMEMLEILHPQQGNRDILNGKEIDIYIPSIKLCIEYNGLRWHSEEFGKDHRYHLDKLNKCNNKGLKLIQIFEDEWVNHREICESKLKQICGLNHNPKIFARKCEIREIKKKSEVYDFLDHNHIQGQTGCTVALGAYYNDNLVGVMTFKKEKEGYWDLNRFATDINYQCVGIGGKLFKHFITHYDFQEIKSFADRRWTTDPTDNLYTKLGFKFDSFVEPTYWYYNPKVAPYRRFHKFGFRKQPLHHQYGLPLTMTEHEMTTSIGYTRIWDCGLIKYIHKV